MKGLWGLFPVNVINTVWYVLLPYLVSTNSSTNISSRSWKLELWERDHWDNYVPYLCGGSCMKISAHSITWLTSMPNDCFTPVTFLEIWNLGIVPSLLPWFNFASIWSHDLMCWNCFEVAFLSPDNRWFKFWFRFSLWIEQASPIGATSLFHHHLWKKKLLNFWKVPCVSSVSLLGLSCWLG